MVRPSSRGDKLALTEEEAAEIAQTALDRDIASNAASDPNRGAPPATSVATTRSGSIGAPGRSRSTGSGARQSSSTRPTVGFRPRPTSGARPNAPEPTPGVPPPRPGRPRVRGRANDGTAYWLEAGLDAPGPYDDMEQRPFAERCLLSFSSTAGPPMMPALYNNHKRIVQGEDTVVILVEMVHDARIVRMNAEHDPPEFQKWLGDSIGWWEGDTLVVETTNFRDRPAYSQGSKSMKVTERFRMESADKLIYTFTVDDPSVWSAPFTGEYAWPRSDNKVFEYACHEANYALEGIMHGARLLEAEFCGEKPEGVANPTR